MRCCGGQRREVVCVGMCMKAQCRRWGDQKESSARAWVGVVKTGRETSASGGRESPDSDGGTSQAMQVPNADVEATSTVHCKSTRQDALKYSISAAEHLDAACASKSPISAFKQPGSSLGNRLVRMSGVLLGNAASRSQDLWQTSKGKHTGPISGGLLTFDLEMDSVQAAGYRQRPRLQLSPLWAQVFSVIRDR